MISDKHINKLYSQGYTFFLDLNEQKEIKRKLNKKNLKTFSPFKECEKVIFYTSAPPVSLIEINPSSYIKHQDVMGAIFSLGLSKDVFGDIIFYDNKYYVYVLNHIKDYLLSNLNLIKKTLVKVNEVNIDYLKDYQREYEEMKLIVSSERIDNVISKITKTSREGVKERIRNKEIILNYEILSSFSKVLKKNDIFSIRRHGKYKYGGIINKTKNNNYIILIYKYL